MRLTSVVMMLICLPPFGATAQVSMPQCTSTIVAAVLPKLPAEIVLDDNRAIEQLSAAYGCQLATAETPPSVTASNKTVGTLAGIYTDPSSFSFGGAATGASNYWVIKNAMDKQYYALDSTDAKFVGAYAGKYELQLDSVASKNIAKYNPDKFTPGLVLYGPNTELLASKTTVSLAWISMKLTPAQRYLLTFQTEPNGAKLLNGNRYIADTTVTLDADARELTDFHFIKAGYRDCAFSDATKTEGLDSTVVTVFCSLVRK